MAVSNVERPNKSPRSQSRPAWQTIADIWDTGQDVGLSPRAVEQLRPLDRHTQRNSDAEYAFYHLQSRFQRYAAEVLSADERILSFVPWTAAVTESRRHRLGRWLAPGDQQAVEGLLVVTDRHVMLLRDAAESVGKTLTWGYVMTVTAHERLANVECTMAPDGTATLHINLATATARESIAWRFPVSVSRDVDQAGKLLRAFIPRAGERHPRRVGSYRSPEPPTPTPSNQSRRRAEVCDPAIRATLEARLMEALNAHLAPDGTPRRIWISVLVPAAGSDERMRLLAVTQEHIWHISEEAQSVAHSLSRVTSLELRHSVLGSSIAWMSGDADDCGQTTVPFPIVAAADGIRLFAALRRALTLLPTEAAGPDLPDPTDQTETDMERSDAFTADR